MKNDINEDYVSFQVAKLLKEKGFAVYCTSLYTEDGKQNDVGNYNGVDDDNYVSYSRPTHSLAIKWIRENFGYYIGVLISTNTKYSYSIQMTDGEYVQITSNEYDSPEEAIEAALLYTLKNLI